MAPVIDKASGGWRGSRGADHGEMPLCWLIGMQLLLRNSSGDTSYVFSLPVGLHRHQAQDQDQGPSGPVPPFCSDPNTLSLMSHSRYHH